MPVSPMTHPMNRPATAMSHCMSRGRTRREPGVECGLGVALAERDELVEACRSRGGSRRRARAGRSSRRCPRCRGAELGEAHEHARQAREVVERAAAGGVAARNRHPDTTPEVVTDLEMKSRRAPMSIAMTVTPALRLRIGVTGMLSRMPAVDEDVADVVAHRREQPGDGEARAHREPGGSAVVDLERTAGEVRRHGRSPSASRPRCRAPAPPP